MLHEVAKTTHAWGFRESRMPVLEKLALQLQVGIGRPEGAGAGSGREVWVEFGETHLYKHLGSVRLGPAGGAQGNKQLWFENLTVLFGAPGKQMGSLTAVFLPLLYLQFCKAYHVLIPCSLTKLVQGKCRKKPQTKLTKTAHKRTKQIQTRTKQ